MPTQRLCKLPCGRARLGRIRLPAAKVVGREFVVSGRDTPTLLDRIEEAFDHRYGYGLKQIGSLRLRFAGMFAHAPCCRTSSSHAVGTNAHALHVFRHHVTDIWRRTLRRRSQKDRKTWKRMTQLVDDWLPKPIILHPWPSERFAVTHPRWEPCAGKPPVRLCAGGAQ
jgi:hypothetical protein